MDTTELCYTPAVGQKALLDDKQISTLELIDAHITRIESLNPKLNAFVTLRLDEARAEAKAMDAARARAKPSGVLQGLPIGVKDCFQTKGVRTTMACLALSDQIPDFDHLVVEREKAAGAIILGKLNTPEFTMARNTCSNPIFGSTRNPWDLSLCPGASSGGSGAALATGLCALADGSDIGGSVRNPAAWCNIVGHRPTTWVIPDVPNPRLWQNMNTAGPMARTVTDTALFLSALAGPDPRCPVPMPAPFAPGVPALARDLADVKVGWSADHGSLPIDPSIRSNFDSQREIFQALGAKISEHHLDVTDVRECYDILAFSRVTGDTKPVYDTAFDGLAPELAARQVWFEKLTGADFALAEERRLRLWKEVVDAFEKFDVLVWPDDLSEAFGHDDEQTAMNHNWVLLCIAPLLNLPAITVPCGFSAAGVPRGLQVTGRPGADLEVLQVAYAYEQATRFGERRPDLG